MQEITDKVHDKSSTVQDLPGKSEDNIQKGWYTEENAKELIDLALNFDLRIEAQKL